MCSGRNNKSRSNGMVFEAHNGKEAEQDLKVMPTLYLSDTKTLISHLERRGGALSLPSHLDPDFNAAFDTVDHGILFRRLSTSVGLSGAFLKWLASFSVCGIVTSGIQ